MGVIENYKKTVMIVVRLFSNACGEKLGEKVGEQIGGEHITVLLYSHSRIPSYHHHITIVKSFSFLSFTLLSTSNFTGMIGFHVNWDLYNNPCTSAWGIYQHVCS